MFLTFWGIFLAVDCPVHNSEVNCSSVWNYVLENDIGFYIMHKQIKDHWELDDPIGSLRNQLEETQTCALVLMLRP